MDAPPRKHRDSGRRAELIEASARCFSARPFDEVSMDDIATEAGVAKGLLFYYFGSKRGCYLAVISDFFGKLVTAAELDTDRPFLELVSAGLDRYLDFAENAEPAYRLIVSGGLGADPEANAVMARERAKYRAMVVDVLYPGQSEPPLLRVALEGFLSFMEGATLAWLTSRDISRQDLHALIMTMAPAVTSAVVSVEPKLAFDPVRLVNAQRKSR